MSEYTNEELLERLGNFDSDSVYEVGLIAAAKARIEQLLSEVADLEEERRDLYAYYPQRPD